MPFGSARGTETASSSDVARGDVDHRGSAGGRHTLVVVGAAQLGNDRLAVDGDGGDGDRTVSEAADAARPVGVVGDDERDAALCAVHVVDAEPEPAGGAARTALGAGCARGRDQRRQPQQQGDPGQCPTPPASSPALPAHGRDPNPGPALARFGPGQRWRARPGPRWRAGHAASGVCAVGLPGGFDHDLDLVLRGGELGLDRRSGRGVPR